MQVATKRKKKIPVLFPKQDMVSFTLLAVKNAGSSKWDITCLLFSEIQISILEVTNSFSGNFVPCPNRSTQVSGQTLWTVSGCKTSHLEIKILVRAGAYKWCSEAQLWNSCYRSASLVFVCGAKFNSLDNFLCPH